ncbi:hypothetical protein E4U44_003468 [Claviceps purpurea]|nr:hypothetical protein E4U44_003468 [Claviceps purpurea]
MDAIAVPQPGEEVQALAPRSTRHRKYSLYTSRMKPLIIDRPAQEKPPQMPDLPTLPISPRWDSLSYGPHLLDQTTTSIGSRARSPNIRPEPPTTQQLPVRGRSAVPMLRPIHGRGPLKIISNGSEARSASPSRPLMKSSAADMHAPDGSPVVENFSRPRKPSIRRQHELSDDIVSPEPIMSRWVDPSSPHDAGRVSEWQRPRRPSASSIKSSSSPVSPLPPSRGEHVEPRPHHRARNITGSPALAAARTQMANGRSDNMVSTPNASPGLGGAVPWVSGEELRSSFRSQLTASTTPGTAVTERSSVLTKESSVTSFEYPDEPSLEDVMCMYEKGFADDDDEDDADLHRDRASEVNTDLRPTTAAPTSHSIAVITPLVDDPVSPPLPTSRLTLDAEIRQSRMLFTSPAFTCSVAAIAGKADMDKDTADKRDSAKSLDSDPSIASGSVGVKSAGATALASSSPIIFSPSRSSSRSPSPPPSTHDHAFATTSSSPTLLSPPSPLPSTPLSQTPITTTTTATTSTTTTTTATATEITTPTTPMPVEPEDPGSRDRYGFKKANQSVNREQYDAWNKDYSFYLARRRRKWITYLKDCGLMTDRPIRFPSPCAKTKRFVRKGIPPDWRGAAWFYYAGGPAILAKYSGLYEKLLHQSAKLVDVEAIERDLHRTFPDNIQFKPSGHCHSTASSSVRHSQSTTEQMSADGDKDKSPGPPPAVADEPPIITSLRRVLHAFSVYNPRIGYCQSLNFLAGLLLLFVETEEQCFWLLNVITIIYLPGTHDMSLEGSKVDLGVLMTELRDSMPSVWDKIGGELENLPTARPSTSKSFRKARPLLRRRGEENRLSTERLPPITLCMTAWFMSCYIGTLPIETTLRVWDVFFYEGSKTLFRIALAIFKVGESEIKSVKDPMEMFGVVQAIPRRMIDANALMEACFKRRNGFGHLSQETIDERRQERRDKAKRDRERHSKALRAKASFNGDMADGNMTEAESSGPLSRRGTLFGKKKKEDLVRAVEI